MTLAGSHAHLTRRMMIGSGAGAVTMLLLRPARATDDEMRDAVRAFVGTATVREGRVSLDLPPLVENGNAVPLTVIVESPMTSTDHVETIAIFNTRNPQPNVATFHLNPRCGRAQVSTRIRLADTQAVTAIARMSDGSLWSASAEAVVTLAACVEGL